jgi:hypothetical protein
MTLSTIDVDPEEPVATGPVHERPLPRWSIVSAISLALLLIIGTVVASHYQPIHVFGGWGSGGPHGAHHEMTTQELWLRNTGPVGVTVVSLGKGEYSGLHSVKRLAPTLICPIETPHSGDCRQNRTTGFIEGTTFHPISLTTDTNRPILFRYKYECAAGTGVTEGTSLTFSVTYRFLWFTHTAVFTEPADTFACPAT